MDLAVLCYGETERRDKTKNVSALKPESGNCAANLEKQGMKKTLALLTVLAALAPASSFAADVEFTATVASTCTIDNLNAGSLAVNGDASVMASTLPGGTPGTADVTANSNLFTLSISDPTSFATGSGPSGTTFASQTSFAGGTIAGGSSAAVPAGTTPAVVNLMVDAGPGNSFANGSYSALVTLTCS